MTTTTYGAVANAMAAIHAKHLEAGKPAEPVHGTMTCTWCRTTLRYTVLPSGVVRGNCTAAGCLKWVM